MKKEKIIITSDDNHQDKELIKYMILNRKPKIHDYKEKNNRKEIKEKLKNIKNHPETDE